MTKAMLGDGAYNSNSDYQLQASHSYESLLQEVGQALQPAAGGDSITIVDYGCAQGKVSNPLLKTAIAGFRQHYPRTRVFVCHNDQPSNDFGGLLKELAGPDSYLDAGTSDARATPMLVPISFYDPVTPANSVALGISFASAQWLSRPGPADTGTALYFDQLQGSAATAMVQQAHEDWCRFLSRRADELVPGGWIVMDMMGVPDGGSAAGHELWGHMRDIVAGLAEQGRIDQDRLDAYVLPVFERTLEQALQPFGEELADRLTVESHSIRHVPNPLKQRYEEDGNAQAFAAGFAGFVRAFSEPSLVEGLALDGPTADEIYAQLEARLVAGADSFTFEVHPLTLVLRAV